ncbi:hypothetical protein D3C73_1319770 [compost metagenome]
MVSCCVKRASACWWPRRTCGGTWPCWQEAISEHCGSPWVPIQASPAVMQASRDCMPGIRKSRSRHMSPDGVMWLIRSLQERWIWGSLKSARYKAGKSSPVSCWVSMRDACFVAPVIRCCRNTVHLRWRKHSIIRGWPRAFRCGWPPIYSRQRWAAPALMTL